MKIAHQTSHIGFHSSSVHLALYKRNLMMFMILEPHVEQIYRCHTSRRNIPAWSADKLLRDFRNKVCHNPPNFPERTYMWLSRVVDSLLSNCDSAIPEKVERMLHARFRRDSVTDFLTP